MLPHTQILELVNACFAYGIQHVVISPGSRSAPITLAFARHGGFEIIVVADERSAAYRGLGISQITGKPVALVCTSGTAAVNYAPAITEAFYQNILLVAITADRPPEMIDQADGQAIRQLGIYGQHIGMEVNLPIPENELILKHAKRLIQQTICFGIENSKPVHINVPLREPLYNLPEQVRFNSTPLHHPKRKIEISESNLSKIEIPKSSKACIIFGQMASAANFEDLVELISNQTKVVVFKDPLCNVNLTNAVKGENWVLMAQNAAFPEFEIVITIGESILMKPLKVAFKKMEKLRHFALTTQEFPADVFGKFAGSISQKDLENWLEALPESVSNPSEKFISLADAYQISVQEQLNKMAWGEAKVMYSLFENLDKQQLVIHLGNSTIPRWLGWMPKHYQFEAMFCNRGTSGIDGSVSTAVGSALADPNRIHVLICGDLSFMYDVNALLGNVPANLRIVVINNFGGGIFRLLKEASEQPENQELFATPQQVHLGKLTEAYGLTYFQANDFDALNELFKHFLKPKEKAAVLEIQVDSTSAKTQIQTILDTLQHIPYA